MISRLRSKFDSFLSLSFCRFLSPSSLLLFGWRAGSTASFLYFFLLVHSFLSFYQTFNHTDSGLLLCIFFLHSIYFSSCIHLYIFFRGMRDKRLRKHWRKNLWSTPLRQLLHSLHIISSSPLIHLELESVSLIRKRENCSQAVRETPGEADFSFFPLLCNTPKYFVEMSDAIRV